MAKPEIPRLAYCRLCTEMHDGKRILETRDDASESIVGVLVNNDQAEVVAGLRLQRLEKSRRLGYAADRGENEIDARRADYSARG